MIAEREAPVCHRHDVDRHSLKAIAGCWIHAKEWTDGRTTQQVAYNEPPVAKVDDLLRLPLKARHDLTQECDCIEHTLRALTARWCRDGDKVGRNHLVEAILRCLGRSRKDVR